MLRQCGDPNSPHRPVCAGVARFYAGLLPGCGLRAFPCERHAGIEIPETMEGTSLRPLLEQPELELKSAAFSQYVRRPKNSPDGKRYMGYSMVTSRYHYVEWYQWSDETKTAGELAGIELYDLRADPDENTNIAGHPENVETAQDLAEKLKAGWRAALN